MNKLLIYFFVKQYYLILSSTYIINVSNFFVHSALLSSKQYIFLICLYFALLSALVKSSYILTLMCLSTSSLDKSATVSTWLEWSVWINFETFQKPRMWEHIYSALFLNSSNILLRTNAFSYSSTNAPSLY